MTWYCRKLHSTLDLPSPQRCHSAKQLPRKLLWLHCNHFCSEFCLYWKPDSWQASLLLPVPTFMVWMPTKRRQHITFPQPMSSQRQKFPCSLPEEGGKSCYREQAHLDMLPAQCLKMNLAKISLHKWWFVLFQCQSMSERKEYLFQQN